MTKPGLVQMHGILVFLHKFHRLYLLPYNFIFFFQKSSRSLQTMKLPLHGDKVFVFGAEAVT